MENEENKVYVNLKKVPLESERAEKREIRKHKFLIFMLAFLCLISGLFFGFVLSRRYSQSDDRQTAVSANVYSEIQTLIKKRWLYADDYEDIDTELEDKALYGMTEFEEDLFTSYMSKEEMDAFADSINRGYVGIGVEYSSKFSVPLVTKVFKDSPAEISGILAGDFITSVDGVSTENMESEELRERVLGVKGTEVKIGIQRGSEEMVLSVIRDEISSTVFAYAEDDYVVMEINSFGESTADEIVRYLDPYKDDYHKIIIDIRNNGGGYQTAVRDVCGLFMGNHQVYLRQKGVDEIEMVDYTNATVTYDNFDKIVILINNDTASAAEVFALDLKEEVDNVTLVGKTTYGKGVIQTNHALSNGGILKLTTYYWYSPKGTSIHNTGIEPDVEVDMPTIYYDYYVSMEDDEYYEYDSVSEVTRISEVSLEYLGYAVDRKDGYFDKSMAEQLRKYKNDNNLGDDSILDKDTYQALLSDVNYQLNNNKEKDTQMMKAIEVLHEN